MKSLRNLALVLFVALPLFAVAQVVADPVQYMVAPDSPGPNETVTIEAQGVGNLLGGATITWTNNGTKAAQGVGLSHYTFVTGALGSHTTIGVTINTAQGVYSQTFNFTPALVNLVWEADTTVPPFYKGKALYSAGSPLRVLALPVAYQGGARLAASALSYQWTLNDEPQQDASGLGRSAFSFVGDQLQNNEDVSVDVYLGTAKIAHGEVVIPATAPQLVLYQRDPLRALLLDTAFPPAISLSGKELTVQAEPFYFSRPDRAGGSLSYSWQLNGQDTTGPDAQSGILTLRQTGSGQGAAQVSVALQDYNSNAFVQNASAALTLVFGSQGSLLNLFGI